MGRLIKKENNDIWNIWTENDEAKGTRPPKPEGEGWWWCKKDKEWKQDTQEYLPGSEKGHGIREDSGIRPIRHPENPMDVTGVEPSEHSKTQDMHPIEALIAYGYRAGEDGIVLDPSGTEFDMPDLNLLIKQFEHRRD